MRPNAVNQSVALRNQKHSGSTGHGQIQLSRDSARRQVIEKNALGPNLDGKSQRLSFANSKGALEHKRMELLFQVFDVQPRGQCRNRRRDFGSHPRRNENRLKDGGKQF